MLEASLPRQKMENELNELQAESQGRVKRVDAELKKEILPIEQRPEIAKSLGGLFDGSSLTIIDTSSALTLLKPIQQWFARILWEGPPKKT